MADRNETTRYPDKSPPTEFDPALPPVEPPSAMFLLQLFLIPMIIVSIIVLVWMMFSWLAHMGNDPGDLVAGLKRGRWQDAATLADLLRDPQKEFLRDDPRLAGELSAVLRQQIASGDTEEETIKSKIFLCQALGEFHVPEALPPLLEAAAAENGDADVEVRQFAVQAIAVLAGHLGNEATRDLPDVLPVVIEASRQRDPAGDTKHRRANLRMAAAFTLGVLGGDQALRRLEGMLDDPVPNVRYNAATGLARNGDGRAVPGLLSMLDPGNANVVSGEHEENHERKRIVVQMNGIRAARMLVQRNPSVDLGSLKSAVEQLAHSDSPRAVRFAAREAVADWKAGQ